MSSRVCLFWGRSPEQISHSSTERLQATQCVSLHAGIRVGSQAWIKVSRGGTAPPDVGLVVDFLPLEDLRTHDIGYQDRF